MLKIGISCRVTEEQKYSEIRNSLSLDWINYLEDLNLIPVLIPNGLSDLTQFIKILDLDGIILSGGNNVDPELYGSKIKMESVFSVRDKSEYLLIEYALSNRIPLIGVCRGMSIINIYFNGKLTHNIINHVNVKHNLIINNFKKYFGEELRVNSYHNHAIKKKDLADPLIPFAVSNDHFIEGFYNDKKTVFGLQWHPERESNPSVSNFIIDVFNRAIK